MSHRIANACMCWQDPGMQSRPTQSDGIPSDTCLRPLLDVPEAAAMLHVSERYVRLIVARGQLACVRLGRRTLIRRADLDAVIARGGLTVAG